MKFILLILSVVLASNAYAFEIDKNTIRIEGQITEKTTKRVIDKLKRYKKGSVVKVYIDSPGGDMDQAFVITGVMDKFTTECFAKEAMSAAFFILQTCNLRKASDSSKLMFHSARILTTKNITMHEGDLLSAAISLSYSNGYMIGTVARRIGIPLGVLVAQLNQIGDWFMTPKEAVDLNLVDVVESLK